MSNLILKFFKSKVEELTSYPPEVNFNLVRETKFKHATEAYMLIWGLGSLINMMLIFNLEKPSQWLSYLLRETNWAMPAMLLATLGFGVFHALGYKAGWFLYEKFLLLVHNCLPNKESRELDIVIHWDNYLRRTNPYFEHNFNQELIDLGLKTFCAKYFNKSGSGFLRFMDARIKSEFSFLYYALSIPRAKELSVDSLRKILLVYPGNLKLDGPLKLEENFSAYSLEEIEEVFTSLSDKGLLKSLTAGEVYPVVRNLNELASAYIPGYIKEIDGLEIEGFKFQVLKNKADYHYVSGEFHNCVSRLWDEGSCFIVARGEKEKVCIQVYKGIIQEMKLAENLPVTNPKRFYQMLAPYKIMEKKSFFKRFKLFKLGRTE